MFNNNSKIIIFKRILLLKITIIVIINMKKMAPELKFKADNKPLEVLQLILKCRKDPSLS
jgi:hypothetical protein